MDWKSYLTGIVTTIAVGGFIYLCANTEKVRSEKVVSEFKIDNTTIQYLKIDKKLASDDYKMKIFDKDGQLKVVELHGDQKPQNIKIISESGLETKLDF